MFSYYCVIFNIKIIMDGFKFYEDLVKLGEVYPCIVTNKIMMHDNIKTGGYEVIIKGNKGIGFIDSGLIADGFENLNIDDEAEFIVCGFDEERGLKFEPTIQTMKAKGMTPRLLKGKITAVSNEKLAYHVPNPLLKRAHLTEERRKLLEKQEIHFYAKQPDDASFWDGLRQDYEIEVLDYGFKQIVVCIKTSDGLQIVRQVDF